MIGWIARIFGGGLKDTATGIAGIFAENKEQRAQRGHAADMATVAQFAAEFHARANRSWWDSFVDGLNRLPRPLMAIGVLGLFAWSAVDPGPVLAVAQAWAALPEGFWVLASIIVTFYFGGRMQMKARSFTPGVDPVTAARKLADVRDRLDRQTETGGGRVAQDAIRRFRENVDEATYRAAMADTDRRLPNRVIAEWNRRRKAAAGEAADG